LFSTFNDYVPGMLGLLPEDAHAAIMASGSRVKIKSGQLFQNRGNRIVALCIILKGKLRMMTIGVDGSVQLTAILGPGQQFNEPTLFANTTRPHDAEAVGDSEILVLSKRDYERLAEEYPSIVHALMVSSVNRLHHLIEALNDLRALPKSVVLARVLLKNARHLSGDSGAVSVSLGLTQEDIAMFLGVTRAYLNKVVGQLSGLGLIEVSYRNIRILDMAALEEWIVSQLTYDNVEVRGVAAF
jgi:CRP/FNR family transcriptional regulator, cyclic AMP receptor protein